jgi:hypothetical protein
MADQDIEITLTAVDDASAVIDEASQKINADVEEVSTAQQGMSDAVDESSGSLRDFTVGASGAATAGFNLYNAYDRVNISEISLDRSNLMVKSSSKSLEDAQRAVTDAVTLHGAGSEQAQKAEEALSIAQDRLTVANERAEQAQTNVNRAMLSAALQVIPSTITMVDSLSRVWKNFPDMTGVLETLGSNITMVGNKALIASVSVAGFVGGFLVGYEAINQFGDALGPVGRALMVVVPAIIAAAAAVWMLQEGITLGVATVALVAAGLAVGAMVANLQNYGNGLGQGSKVPAMAAGGVVESPTFALVGEAGPEIVMPLSQYEAKRSKSSGLDANNPQQVSIDLGGMHFYGDIADSKFLEKAAIYTADKISEAVNLRRGT